MGERLYTLRHDQGYFDTGLALGQQVLLGNTVHEIVAHWFDLEGQFLRVERFRMAVDPPRFPGTRIYVTGSAYHRAAEAEMAALKQTLGFVPADIRVRAFESEEAAIADLPSEYVQYLEAPESYSAEDRKWYDEYVSEWRRKGQFVLCWSSEYWLSNDGEVMCSPA